MVRIFTVAGCLLAVSLAAADDSAEFFESRVRPVLSQRCWECHRRAAEGGLRLDTREALLKGGESGPAIVPGKPRQSLLVQAIRRQHDEIKMPPEPEKPLSRREVEGLVQWIAAGAAWPQASAAQRADRHGITDEERQFWSFQPVQATPTPQVADPLWQTHPIDAFVRGQHERRGLNAAPLADPRPLIRRATYDLTGLPPSAEEVERFEAACETDADAAYAELLERLLDSPAYGERWGQHWLDLVRYADTAGDAADFPVPEAYKYRNWVIQAFNDDLPYDQFVRQQLAGDLLPHAGDHQRWRQVVATGYIAVSRRIGVSPHGLRHITIEDTLNNFGKTFLGLTIGCARCHDHKFDPIPASDYYALYGIFDSTVYPHAGAEHKPHRADFVYRIGKQASDEQLGSLRRQLQEWDQQERAAFERYRDFQRKPVPPGKTRAKAWQEVLSVREARRELAETFPNLETAYAVGEGTPHDVQIHKQGDPRSSGETVGRGFLQVLGGQTLSKDAPGSGRLALAQWVAAPANPLTARVMVNRIWHHHFGRGIVATPSDFGVRGAKPTHSQLLDYLAAAFVDGGWSVKQMHRLMMTSRTYRLSAGQSAANDEIDPTNLYLWRASRRRLDAEQLRDTLLLLSGQLDREPGGRHPFPHRLTYFYRQHEPFVGEFSTHKRSVYLLRQRIRKHPFLDMFDGPDGNLHFGARRATTTTLQALYFMNSPFVHEQAEQIAKRVPAAAESLPQRVDWASRQLLGRAASEREVAAAREFHQQIVKRLPDGDPQSLAAWSAYLRAMIGSNEFLYLD